MFRKLVSLVLIGSSLLATGCNGGQETESVAYVLVIGFDRTADGKQRVTYQISVPKGSTGTGEGDSSGMGGKGDKGQGWIINTIVAPSSAEARTLLNASMSRIPNVSHTTALLFGEETAREGLEDFVSFIVRSRDYRESIFMIVVSGTAEDYITTIPSWNRSFLSITMNSPSRLWLGIILCVPICTISTPA